MALEPLFFAIGLTLTILHSKEHTENEMNLITEEQKKGRVGINEFSGVFRSFWQDSCSRNL